MPRRLRRFVSLVHALVAGVAVGQRMGLLQRLRVVDRRRFEGAVDMARSRVTWTRPWPQDGLATVGSQRTIRNARKQKTPVESTIWGFVWNRLGRSETS